jgi:Cupin domain
MTEQPPGSAADRGEDNRAQSTPGPRSTAAGQPHPARHYRDDVTDPEVVMQARRVVTGHAADGKSVFVSDETIEPVTLTLLPGAEFHQLWARDATASIPDDTTTTPRPVYFPAVGGFRFGFFTLGPESVASPADIDIEAALNELSEKLPGMAEVMEPEHPGMHTTDTIDFDIVISGEVWLELDDGAEVQLRAGDSVIQNGTRHAWHNRSSQPCTLAVALIGAARTPG